MKIFCVIDKKILKIFNKKMVSLYHRWSRGRVLKATAT